MSKTTDIRVLEVTARTESFAYRTPMKFGGRVVTDVVLLHVAAEVETRDGRRAIGHGSMPMGNAWAWPSGTLPPAATLDAMLGAGRRIAQNANDYEGLGHPLVHIEGEGLFQGEDTGQGFEVGATLKATRHDPGGGGL